MRSPAALLSVFFLAACQGTSMPVTEAPVAEPTSAPTAIPDPSVVLDSQGGPESGTDTADRLIQEIRSEYQRIQSDPNLTRKVIRYETPPDAVDIPPMGGTLTLFFRDGQLVKALDDGGEDHGIWKEEYYYRPGGEPFFIYANNAYGGAANPTEVRYQLRLYLDQNRVHKVLTNGSAPEQTDVKGYLKKAKAFYKARTTADVLSVYQ